MVEGLLWYDGDKARGLADKVLAAAERYREKFGVWPNRCYVHPDAVAREEPGKTWVRRNGCSVRVVGSPRILRNHLWIGVEEQRMETDERMTAEDGRNADGDGEVGGVR